MVGENVFILLGQDLASKKIKLDNIRSSLQKNEPNLLTSFIYPKEISSPALQLQMQNFAFSKRLFVFKNAELLSGEITHYLLQFFKNNFDKDFYLFDFEVESSQKADLLKDGFYKFIFGIKLPFTIDARKREYSLKDLSFALRKGSCADALVVIAAIFEHSRRDAVAMQALGLFVKMFSGLRAPFKQQSLGYLFEADRLLKTGLLDPQTVLEILTMKLAQSGCLSAMTKDSSASAYRTRSPHPSHHTKRSARPR